MSTAWIYHMFGVTGYQILYGDYLPGMGLVIGVTVPEGKWRCANCGSHLVIRRGVERRLLRTLSIGRQSVWLMIEVPRLECRECGKVRRLRVGLAAERVSYTERFERYVLELLAVATIWDVARHLGISWGTVKEIQKRNLQRRFGTPALGAVKRIAIDELAIGQGQRFLTLVLDLDSGAVVFVGRGKGGEALWPFWRRLRRARARIAAVAMDMSVAYLCAVRANLPQAAIVFDRFHVLKLYNEKLTELRRELYREAVDRRQQRVLKGIRWLLLKNAEKLTKKRRGRRRSERERLDEALRLNEPLAIAYYLKEDLRMFWEQANKGAAAQWLAEWIAQAESSGIRLLQQFARTLAGYRSGLLAWYDHSISTGPLEGVNNKIRVMQRMAYGFRDQEFFILKIYALHEAKFKLVG